VPPFAWFFAALFAMLILGALAPGPDVLPDWLRPVGVATVFAGILLNVAASAAFRRRATTADPDGQPAALVDDGVYAYTRNPMYLGGIVILTGVVFLTDAITTAIVPPLYALVAARRFLPPEERRLETTFGDAYRDYRSRVRRWV
jgi:protein-S-isoprenylcysteine O-methyltransferase Ste14